MSPVDVLRQRVEAELDRPCWHEGTIPAADAREAILAALDEPLTCGTCNGSGIAPDHSPQPDDEQPCPECAP